MTGVRLGGVLLAALAVVGAGGYVQRAVSSERRAVAAIEEQVTSAQARVRALTDVLQAAEQTTRRAAAARVLLDRHRAWDRVFARIEATTLPDVRYQGFVADVTGSILLPAFAPDVRSAAQQVLAWRDAEGVRAAETSGFSSTVDQLGVIRGVRFNLRLTADDALFTWIPRSSGETTRVLPESP